MQILYPMQMGLCPSNNAFAVLPKVLAGSAGQSDEYCACLV